MDNIIRFPRQPAEQASRPSVAESSSSSTSTDRDREDSLDTLLTRWASRAVFQLPAEFTLRATIEDGLGVVAATTATPVAEEPSLNNAKLTTVLDALLAHCVANLGEGGGVLRLGATLMHQPQRQQGAYHGLSAGEYALVLFSADHYDNTDRATELDATLIANVQKFGGEVECSYQGALGLRIALHLPLAAIASSGAANLINSAGLDGLQVLLVDDDRQARYVVSEVLRRLGCTVTAFADANAALDALDRDDTHYQLVLSDLTMPHMSGAELAARIRKQYSQLPIALMTGFAGSLEADALQELGVFAVLEKPFGKHALGQLLDAAREELAARRILE